MYNLIITGLATQRDTQSLVKILLKVPGLSPEQVSKGLRVPPFNVVSVEKIEQVEKIKSILEKFGAICEIEKNKEKNEVEEMQNRKYEFDKKTKDRTKSLIANKVRVRWRFWVIISIILGLFALLSVYLSEDNDKKTKPNKPKITQILKSSAPAKNSAKTTTIINNELKKDLVKNPYNTEAWKTLYENFEKEGDTASARIAKESYEKAVKAQMVLASLAKTFGNNVRVEITEDAVFYRTSKDLTDREFYEEAAKIRDSLNTKYPGKTLIVENYTTDNRLQSVKLKNADQPKEKDSPK
ncbi:MAG: hypothetical protein LBQ87_07505 [Candidatus Fibromonas sp.]|nr:hypothetical protein [Candidatus Fibromonas sp.]